MIDDVLTLPLEGGDACQKLPEVERIGCTFTCLHEVAMQKHSYASKIWHGIPRTCYAHQLKCVYHELAKNDDHHTILLGAKACRNRRGPK